MYTPTFQHMYAQLTVSHQFTGPAYLILGSSENVVKDSRAKITTKFMNYTKNWL